MWLLYGVILALTYHIYWCCHALISGAADKHEFKAETRKLLDIVAKSLYSEKEVSCQYPLGVPCLHEPPQPVATCHVHTLASCTDHSSTKNTLTNTHLHNVDADSKFVPLLLIFTDTKWTVQSKLQTSLGMCFGNVSFVIFDMWEVTCTSLNWIKVLWLQFFLTLQIVTSLQYGLAVMKGHLLCIGTHLLGCRGVATRWGLLYMATIATTIDGALVEACVLHSLWP